jgi:hypothetical protein
MHRKKAANTGQVSRNCRLGKGNGCNYQKNYGDAIEQDVNLNANQLVQYTVSLAKYSKSKGVFIIL